MSETSQKDLIKSYLNELMTIPASDILMRCSVESSKVVALLFDLGSTEFKLPVSLQLKRILKQASELFKESAIDTLCVSFGGVEVDSHETTPLFLVNATCTLSNQKGIANITIDRSRAILNPFLVHKWAKEGKEISLEEHFTWEENYANVCDQVLGQFKDAVISNVSFVGNFHYHRFAFLREMELLIDEPLNKVLGSILGEVPVNDVPQLSLTDQQISSLDADQAEVIKAVQHSNCVVEGPPGAGKSDLIANLSTKLMFGQHLHLILSEKKSALDVLLRKFRGYELDDFVGSFLQEDTPNGFLKKIMATWKKLEQASNINYGPNLLLSHQKKASLQQLLDKLNSPNLIGETTYASFIEWVGNRSLEEVPFEVNVPSIESWKHEKLSVVQLLKLNVSFRLFSSIRPAFFKQSNPTNKLVEYTIKLKELNAVFELNIEEDFFSFKRYFSLIQLYNNESNKSYFSLFNNHKIQKKFLKISKLYLAIETRFNSLKSLEKNWINLPTDEVFFALEKQISATSLLRRISSKIKLKKWFFEPTINFVDFSRKWNDYLDCRNERNRLISELHLLGIHFPESEVYSILSLLEPWNQSAISDLKTVSSWEPKRRDLMFEIGSKFNECADWLSHNIQLKDGQSYLEVLDELCHHLEIVEIVAPQLANLSPAVYGLMQKFDTVDQIERVVLKSHWVKLGALFPSLMNFNPHTLVDEVETILKEEASEFLLFSKQIWERQRAIFLDYQRLLVTSTSKLSSDQQNLRQLLKQGKRILVKQAGKSRNLMSVRDLIHSEAWIWIKLLHPCWVLTPLQLAKFFPMESDMFEVLVIDEASQLPLTHSFGALQRSKRALICGDSQQMAPTLYFSAQSEQIDVLHQASFYWKKLYLKHHYRSQHTQLIAFSNRYFYNDELVTYPSSNLSVPPIVLHYLEDGRFVHRMNEMEALEVVKSVECELNSNRSIGIVAFSQEQIDCIWNLFSESTQDSLKYLWEKGEGFMKPLEKVQGDECDVLFISMGYAKNEQGNFQLKMGPLNRRNGHRRLNVLLTRAKHQLHFFTSVRSKEFTYSENESMNLLKGYIQWLESSPSIPSLVFPFLSSSLIQGDTVLFQNVHVSIQSATELTTFYNVLKSRGWKIKFV